jgi:TPR repeat protein
MKTILKALLLLVALTAVPVFAQTDYEATKARAEAGDAEAQTSLGVMYQNGRGVAQNYQEAVRWYRLAAEQGHANAQFFLGMRNHFGQGVEQNHQEAVRWYKLAAEKGVGDAHFFLGMMYEYGLGVVQNNERAYVWYSVAEAAAQGNESATVLKNKVSRILLPQALQQAQAQATRCLESNFRDCN